MYGAIPSAFIQLRNVAGVRPSSRARSFTVGSVTDGVAIRRWVTMPVLLVGDRGGGASDRARRDPATHVLHRRGVPRAVVRSNVTRLLPRRNRQHRGGETTVPLGGRH